MSGGNAGKDSRAVIESDAFSDAFAAKQQFGAVGFAGLDVGMHLGRVGLRDHRADFGAFVERIAKGDFAGNVEQTIQQCVADAFLDQQPAAGNAALAGIVVDAIGDAVGGSLQIGIGENDLRTLAAQFEPDALDAAGGDLAKLRADAHRAGEGDHVGPRIFREDLAGRIAIAGDDVEDAVGYAGLAGQFGHADRGARGEFGRLQHDGAAAADRPWHALGRDDEGKVPGRDDADDADWLAQHEAEAVVADIVVGLAFQRTRLAGGVGPEVGAERDLARAPG